MTSIFRLTGVFTYVVMVFLNAFVDLGHKIIIQNTLFKTLDGTEQIFMTAILNALILLPLAFLFTPAGFISDKYSKPKVMQASAWIAVLITSAITVCYYLGQFQIAFLMTLLLAVQSAIYSPAKYGYLREFLGKSKLTQANALVQSTTIIAILAGTFLFSILFEILLPISSQYSAQEIIKLVAPLGWLLVIASLVELILAYKLPKRPAADPAIRFDAGDYMVGRYLKSNLSAVYRNNVIWISIVGLAIFWGISQVMVATFPAHAKLHLGETNTVVIQGLIACTGIGIIVGSSIIGRSSRNYIETGFIPIGAVGISILLFVIPTFSSILSLAISFILIGVFSGFFVVPLNSLIQFHAKGSALSRVLAANNLIQTLSMLGFLGLLVMSTLRSVSPQQILVFLGVIASISSVYTLYRLPHSLIRFVISRLVGIKFSVSVSGLNNLPSQGGVLMLGNHVSFIDWAIVGIASPRKVRFVMLEAYYNKWYIKWFLAFFGCIPISPGNSEKALSSITKALNQGEVVCLFPEGALTRNGQVGEFKRGFEVAAKNASGCILPFYIQGLWGTSFSHSQESKPNKGKSEVSIVFGQPADIHSNVKEVKQKVFELSTSAWQKASEQLNCIGYEWLDTALSRTNQIAVAELNGKPLTNRKLVAATILFSRKIKCRSPEQNIGILLPPSTGGIIANMAIWLSGKTVVNLNYTASIPSLLSAVKKADVKNVYTSKRFIKKLEEKGVDLRVLLEGLQVHYMEDVKDEFSKTQQVLTYAVVKLIPKSIVKMCFAKKVDANSNAAILFSSGSEGEPKGVQLSHKNLLINVKQVSAVLNAQSDDKVLSTLPIFHAFGLTATTLLPMIEGLPAICHPDPTDGRNIAKVVAKYKATLMFATSTFLRLYSMNKRIEPVMFSSLRLVVAGAEKLAPDVVIKFKHRFGKDVYEGFGATELSPVASVNLPDAIDENTLKVVSGGRVGTVGLPLPGSSFRIVDPVSLECLPETEEGLILISGPQVMTGYLNEPEKTADSIVEINGVRWYKTGDKGKLDADGYLTIVDRYSRFAKLGGEMVSLTAVQNEVRGALNSDLYDFVAVALPDTKKGERIVLLVSSEEDVDVSRLKTYLMEKKCNPLLIPSAIIRIEMVPKLGSGKTDFARAKQLADSLVPE